MHACAHNPTGMDPTSEQWIRIRNAMRVIFFNNISYRLMNK